MFLRNHVTPGEDATCCLGGDKSIDLKKDWEQSYNAFWFKEMCLHLVLVTSQRFLILTHPFGFQWLPQSKPTTKCSWEGKPRFSEFTYKCATLKKVSQCSHRCGVGDSLKQQHLTSIATRQ